MFRRRRRPSAPPATAATAATAALPVLAFLLATLGTAFLAGMRHATDPDHVVAVTTIVARERSPWRAARVGALWGLGHTATLLAAGALLVGLRVSMTPRVGLGLELAVAAMLVTLGARNVAGARLATAVTGAPAAPRTLPPVVIGTVHGLAGSAAATLFVTAVIPDPAWAMVALLVFGLATVAGMSLVTLLLALPAALAAGRIAHLQRGLRIASGVASVVFGLVLVHEITVRDGLFSATPQWSPK